MQKIIHYKDIARDRMFPYIDDGFNGVKFIKKQDNFTKTKNIKSSLIFKQDNIDSPLFTIAIPTYNRLDTLKETIKSAIN